MISQLDCSMPPRHLWGKLGCINQAWASRPRAELQGASQGSECQAPSRAKDLPGEAARCGPHACMKTITAKLQNVQDNFFSSLGLR